jgi:plasmid maintenance system antidote protein VapI
MPKRSPHDAALDALLSPLERETHDRRVEALLARNKMLQALEAGRREAALNKTRLAELAGLDASAVRRMLTAQTANPTTDNAFRLFRAMGAQVDVTLPSGERYNLVSGPSNARITSGSARSSARSEATAIAGASSRGGARLPSRSAAKAKTSSRAESRRGRKSSSARKSKRTVTAR